MDWFKYCHVIDLAEECVVTHETALYREGRREDYGGKDKHAHDTHTHDTDLYKTGAKEVLILERAT